MTVTTKLKLTNDGLDNESIMSIIYDIFQKYKYVVEININADEISFEIVYDMENQTW